MSGPTTGPATAVETGRPCPYCRHPLKEGVDTARCGACAAAHHEECWQENGGCAVFACPGGPAETADAKQGKPSSKKPAPAGEQRGRRTRIAAVAVVALLLVGGGVAAAMTLGGSDEETTTGSVQEPTPETEPTPEETAPPDAGLTEEETVEEIAGLLDRSIRGRTATREERYDDANRVRRRILDDLAALDTAHLSRERSLLRRAMRASIRANEVRECPGCVNEHDEAATRLKEDLVEAFNPLAESQLGRTYDADEI